MQYLRLHAVIQRLSNIEDDFHTYHDQWAQHVTNAEMILPNSIFVIGTEDEKHAARWSNTTAGLPGRAFADEGCNLVADSQFCVHTNAYLIHLRLAVYIPAANRQRQIKFGLFRTYARNIRFRGRHSRFHTNSTEFWPLLTLPYNLIELAQGVNAEHAGISYNLFRPVLMRRGDCIFWTSCAETDAPEPETWSAGEEVPGVSRCLFRRGVRPTYVRSSKSIVSFEPMISRYHSAAFTFLKQVPPL